MAERVILASSKNKTIIQLNAEKIGKLPETSVTYCSADSIVSDDDANENYQLEFLHAEITSGMPSHVL
jgi:hypothetical protein